MESTPGRLIKTPIQKEEKTMRKKRNGDIKTNKLEWITNKKKMGDIIKVDSIEQIKDFILKHFGFKILFEITLPFSIDYNDKIPFGLANYKDQKASVHCLIKPTDVIEINHPFFYNRINKEGFTQIIFQLKTQPSSSSILKSSTTNRKTDELVKLINLGSSCWINVTCGSLLAISATNDDLIKEFPFFNETFPKTEQDMELLRQGLFNFQRGDHISLKRHLNWTDLFQQCDASELITYLVDIFLPEQFLFKIKAPTDEKGDLRICQKCQKMHGNMSRGTKGYVVHIPIDKLEFEPSSFFKEYHFVCSSDPDNPGGLTEQTFNWLNEKDYTFSNFLLADFRREIHNPGATKSMYEGKDHRSVRFPAEFEFSGRKFNLLIVGEHVGKKNTNGHWLRHQKTKNRWYTINDEKIIPLEFAPNNMEACFLIYEIEQKPM
jgi:hypothetical protein